MFDFPANPAVNDKYTNSNVTFVYNGVGWTNIGTSGGIWVADTPPALVQGALWFDSVNTQLMIGYVDPSGSQWVIANNPNLGRLDTLPIAFSFTGKPVASARVTVPVVVPLTIPANLTNTRVYCSTNPTATATFTLNKISGGSTTALGTVAIATNGGATLAGAGGSVIAGDAMQMVAPGTQDATLADFGITIAATRA